ncbi:MAG: hypothetical protein ACREMU_12850 [Gemmatimonadaceae bacterium]
MSLMHRFSRHRDTSPVAVQEMRAEMFHRIQELLTYDSVLPDATMRGLRRAAFTLYLDSQSAPELDVDAMRVLEHSV